MPSQVLTTWPVLCGRRTFHDFQGTISKGIHTNAEVDGPKIKKKQQIVFTVLLIPKIIPSFLMISIPSSKKDSTWQAQLHDFGKTCAMEISKVPGNSMVASLNIENTGQLNMSM